MIRPYLRDMINDHMKLKSPKVQGSYEIKN